MAHSDARHGHLQVGVQVRVVLHPDQECPAAPHLDAETGCAGRIIGTERSASTPTHQYLVLFDRPCLYLTPFGACTTIPVRHYARNEIVPVREPHA